MAQSFTGLGLRVKGVVQGVGFRPFVFRLARRLGLTGNVRNTGEGVLIEIYGSQKALEAFVSLLKEEAPPLAKIEVLEASYLSNPAPPIFTVLESETKKATRARIPPDVGVCKACLRELFDPRDRRFRYPFINCTDCGPRFTVIEALPYDREKTTMRHFEMCPRCLAEYTDPASRRFHAEPIACPECGPRLWLSTPEGQIIFTIDPIKEAISALKRGHILAIKGLGGFQLAVDAENERACQLLRERKRRPQKPLAIMVPDLETAQELVYLDDEEKRALLSPVQPILLAQCKRELAPSVAPGLKVYGLMLPYTPLHHLLLREGGFRALVMTSGNLSGEPLTFRNEEALERLGRIADFFLLHDRQIVIGVDDSVVKKIAGKIRPLRRARGFVPDPLPFPAGPPILAVGPHLKNTLTLTRDGEAFISQHIGDLEDLVTEGFFHQVHKHFETLLGIKPALVACDLHPGYLSTKIAEELANRYEIPMVKVPHHVAHAAAVMGEFDLKETLALILDGLGLGPDGTLWGGELLLVRRGHFIRLGHLRPLPQPGGDAAVRWPWRMALSYLYFTFGHKSFELAKKFFPFLEEEKISFILRLLEKRFNAPLTTSAGRLFDAVGALLGFSWQNTYEGETPLKLENQAKNGHRLYPSEIKIEGGKLILDPLPIIEELTKDLLQDIPRQNLAGAFHQSLIEALTKLAIKASEMTGKKEVVLSGGCFQNAILAEGLLFRLKEEGFRVFFPEKLPVNDGGISYGQALWARWLKKPP